MPEKFPAPAAPPQNKRGIRSKKDTRYLGALTINDLVVMRHCTIGFSVTGR